MPISSVHQWTQSGVMGNINMNLLINHLIFMILQMIPLLHRVTHINQWGQILVAMHIYLQHDLEYHDEHGLTHHSLCSTESSSYTYIDTCVYHG